MDRYSIIKKGVQLEWLPDCPVKIEKYNILFDNIEQINLLQIKFKNISSKKIRGLWIGIDGYDDASDNTLSLSNIAYSNVNAVIHQSFGSDIPIKLESKTTVKVKIIIEKVVFEDNTVWRNEQRTIGISLPMPKAIDVYGDLYNQYAIEMKKIGLPFEYAFVDNSDYWVCPCSEINKKSSHICCSCSTEYLKIQALTNIDYLAKANEERLKAEKETAEQIKKARIKEEQRLKEQEQEQKRAVAEAVEAKRQKKEKIKRRMKKIIIGIVLIILLIYIGITIPKLIKYNKALKMIEDGNYDSAIETYTQLNGFLNSEKRLTEANDLKIDKINSEKYAQAVAYTEQGGIDNLIKAAHIYLDLNDYHDSSQKLTETYYNIAVIEYNNGDYSNAASHYKLCGKYNNSQAMVTSSNNQLKLKNAITAYNAGNYENALTGVSYIQGVTNAKPGEASAQQIAEWSKDKIYQQAVGGNLSHEQSIDKLEFINKYGGYKDSVQRINNLKKRCDAISGYYPLKFMKSGYYSTGASYRVTADYKTNEVKIEKTLSLVFSLHDYEYTCQLSALGGTYGSAINYDNSHSLYFYNGYLTDTQFENGQFKFEKSY